MKKFKFLLLLFCFLCLFSTVSAQQVELSKNSLFLELFGNGGVFSINYERSIHTNLYGRIGFGQWSSSDFGVETKFTTLPVLITYLTGPNKSHFEAGGGMLFGKQKETDAFGSINLSHTIIDLTAFIGYRYQAPGRGILFRIGLTPFLSLDNKANYPDEDLGLSGGISIGYHF